MFVLSGLELKTRSISASDRSGEPTKGWREAGHNNVALESKMSRLRGIATRPPRTLLQRRFDVAGLCRPVAGSGAFNCHAA